MPDKIGPANSLPHAGEMAWRENYRRVSNGEQYQTITGATLAHPVSRQWKGYWQRHTAQVAGPYSA